MAVNVCREKTRDLRGLESRIGAAGWGLFFVWTGAAIFLDVGWGFGLIGVGLIMLLGQAARLYSGARAEPFSIVCGSLLILGGLSMLSGITLQLTPIICVAAGLALLLSAVAGNARA